MISQRELERKFTALMKSVKEDDFYKIDLSNRVNCYKCQCGHITKTKDSDAGVTPFKHKCEECGDFSTSTFYTDILPDQKPTQEWYRPSLRELLKIRKNEPLLDHVLKGGLMSRAIINK
jgi:hypothetical protein